MDRIVIRKDTYVDSVFLMALSAELAKTPALEAGHVVLATPANRQLLEQQGFAAGSLHGLSPTDLVIALRAPSEATLAEAEQRTLSLLTAKTHAGASAAERPVGLTGGLAQLPDATLALISVPGQYAAFEAGRALDAGLHVMIFSDNVAVEDEASLKRRAGSLGLLVMGPDCGTALVSGKPLGFANRLRPGPIGLVGASGTGLQEVSCQIHRLGGGVSHMLGTGGRDLSAAVGGLTTLAAIDALAADPATSVLVVVSKPPAREVAAAVLDRLAALDKPSVVIFLGDAARPERGRVRIARDLSEAARLACDLSSAGSPRGGQPGAPTPDAASLARALSPTQRHVRGLFCGGTLAAEALLLLRGRIGAVSSNLDHGVPTPTEAGHSIIDLGDDEFTRGRPHPMIDPTLRAEHIVRRGGDRTTAVLLLDLVLGAGSHADPAGCTTPAIAEARSRNPGLVVICSITGTDLDRQGLAGQQAALLQAGAVVAPSNVAGARLAAGVIEKQSEEGRP
jgi:succinyl-CoA synthetase alpha subunit